MLSSIQAINTKFNDLIIKYINNHENLNTYLYAFDIGTKRTGIAKIKMGNILNDRFARDSCIADKIISTNNIKKYIDDNSIEYACIGWPYNEDKNQEICMFIQSVINYAFKNINFMLCDERFTSQLAKREAFNFYKSSLKNPRKQIIYKRKNIDNIAAIHILETYVDILLRCNKKS